MDGSLVATAWDTIQVMAECCGCEGADDYKLSSWKNATTTDKKQAVPNSCCVLKEKNPTTPEPTNTLLCHTMTSGFWHKRGCIEVLKEWYHSISILTLSAVGGLVVMEILCIVFAARLFKKTNEKKEHEKKKKKEALEKEKAEKELASR
ncbi:tetraspanin-18-like [Ostrea edulis]|uniref:tetraspanin-18-like n=1 Tax=Ostrea edulis TaxID=37623 RepID=UPI0020943D6C|nr:tetraspanin-18-like [Ostrea edulis]